MSKVKVDGGGLRHNEGKLQWHLLPMDLVRETVRVMMFGATKYKPNNWKRGFKYSTVLDCAYRHLDWWAEGEDNCSESGLSHLAHAMCNLVFLYFFHARKKYKKFDDRKEWR